MLIYNITVKLNAAIADAWIRWQLEEHIPEIMQTKLFSDYKILRLLNQDDREGPTIITQFITNSMDNYNDYIERYAPLLREKAMNKWGDGFIAFRSLMETVQ